MRYGMTLLFVMVAFIFIFGLVYAKIIKDQGYVISYDSKPDGTILKEEFDVEGLQLDSNQIINERIYEYKGFEIIDIKYNDNTGVTWRAKR